MEKDSVALYFPEQQNDQGWNQTAYEGTHRKPVRNTDTSWLTQRTWKLLIFPPLFADYASAGADVVIGHGYEFGDPAGSCRDLPRHQNICTEADASR